MDFGKCSDEDMDVEDTQYDDFKKLKSPKQKYSNSVIPTKKQIDKNLFANKPNNQSYEGNKDVTKAINTNLSNKFNKENLKSQIVKEKDLDSNSKNPKNIEEIIEDKHSFTKI
jgi:hypothetical protein